MTSITSLLRGFASQASSTTDSLHATHAWCHPAHVRVFVHPSLDCQRTATARVSCRCDFCRGSRGDIAPLWWRYGDLNPRPMACKATALATELYPQAWPPHHRATLPSAWLGGFVLCTGCGIYTEKGGEFERERAIPRSLSPSCSSTLSRGLAQAGCRSHGFAPLYTEALLLERR